MSISKKNMLTGVLILVVAFIVIAAGGYLLYSQSKSANEAQQEEVTSNTNEAPPIPTSEEDLELVIEASQSGSAVDNPNQVIESPAQEVESATDLNQASAGAGTAASSE